MDPKMDPWMCEKISHRVSKKIKMCYKSKSYDLRMVKMVQKVAPWLPFNIGMVKNEGPILTLNSLNLATGLSQKGMTYFSDPTKK